MKEATILAGRIKQGPLIQLNSEIVYRKMWMVTLKYYPPITRFTHGQCHKFSIIVEQVILPKPGFNIHISKAVLYGPKQYKSKSLMNIRTEYNIIHTDNAMDYFRGEDDTAALQRIMLNKQ